MRERERQKTNQETDLTLENKLKVTRREGAMIGIKECICCGEPRVVYGIIKSLLYHTPETNITVCVNSLELNKNFKKIYEWKEKEIETITREIEEIHKQDYLEAETQGY